MALSVDGHAEATQGGTPITASLTTANANDVIIVFVTENANTQPTITDGQSLTWTLRKASTAGTNGFFSWTFWAKATAALTADTITATAAGVTHMNMSVFAISGANTTTPFDTNVGLPVQSASGSNQTSWTQNVSTTAANTIIFSCFSLNSAGGVTGVTAGAGFTKYSDNASTAWGTVIEYDIVASAQTNLASALSWTAGAQPDEISDAVVQASAVASTLNYMA
jgi:hypothetical protein